MTASDVVQLVGNVVFWPVLILGLFRKLSRKTVDGLLGIAWFLFAVSNIMQHDVLSTSLDTVFAVWHLYDWWNRGGGDDTKRRLKDALKKFQPTRRTAPVAA